MNKKTAFIQTLLDQPVLTWVLVGFAMAFYAFFIDPVFLNSQSVMQFLGSIPIKDPIGTDLNLIIDFSRTWFVGHQSPYTGLNLYSPLTLIVFAPLMLLRPAIAYKLITWVNLLCFGLITLFLPAWLNRDKLKDSWNHHRGAAAALLILLFVSGILSYGFQFELERGEYDLIVMSICLVSLYLYHFQPRLRLLAYFLFTLSVQLKLYPVIFIVFLVSDWSDWKNNLKRWAGLLTGSLVGFFIYGPQILMDFINALKIMGTQSGDFMWMGNHSIRSFAIYALPRIGVDLQPGGIWPAPSAGMTQPALYLLLAGCLLIIWLKVAKQNAGGINPPLLLACTIGVLLIPSISDDSALCVLPGIMAIFFYGYHLSNSNPRRMGSIFLILLLSSAYASTLFSYTHKAVIWQNNLPALMVMLLCCTGLWMLDDSGAGKTLGHNFNQAR